MRAARPRPLRFPLDVRLLRDPAAVLRRTPRARVARRYRRAPWTVSATRACLQRERCRPPDATPSARARASTARRRPRRLRACRFLRWSDPDCGCRPGTGWWPGPERPGRMASGISRAEGVAEELRELMLAAVDEARECRVVHLEDHREHRPGGERKDAE